MPDNLVKTINEMWIVGGISGLAGLIDYLKALQSGSRVFTFASLFIHITFCVFMGFLAGLAVIGLGHSAELACAASGAAALLNERLLKMITSYVKGRGVSND
ncbi:MAG: phage holin family protein [Bermanella sp.]